MSLRSFLKGFSSEESLGKAKALLLKEVPFLFYLGDL